MANRFILPTVAQWDGLPEQTFCRIERLKCTRRYREHFPGGMAHVLTQLRVDPQTESGFIFDGLRGENEVSYAAKALPNARFVVLEAPPRAGEYSTAELRDKLEIVVALFCNYDPDGTRATLEAIAPQRTLVIDTTVHSPQEIAKQVFDFVEVPRGRIKNQ
ncbi:MAG: hypothetical protein SW833_10880 [Cyanobacteriota bacterium]|nr:hypothetical protein [Cyanobacteriota bacterium]